MDYYYNKKHYAKHLKIRLTINHAMLLEMNYNRDNLSSLETDYLAVNIDIIISETILKEFRYPKKAAFKNLSSNNSVAILLMKKRGRKEFICNH